MISYNSPSIEIHELQDGVPIPQASHIIVDSLLFGEDFLRTQESREPFQKIFGLVHHLESLEPDISSEKRNTSINKEQRQFISMHGLIVTSHFMKELLQKRNPCPPMITCLPGVDLKSQRPPPGSIDSGVLKILTAANFIPRKGLMEGLKSLEKFKGRWHWTIAGHQEMDDQYFKAFQQRAESFRLTESIDLTGPIPQEKLFDLFSDHHLYLSPSKFETCGMGVLESIAHGLPILAPSIGETPYLAGSPPRGILYSPMQEDGLTRSLERLFSDPTILRNLNQQAKVKHPGIKNWKQQAALLTSELDRLSLDS